MRAVADGEMPKPVLEHFGLHQWLQAVDTTMSRRAIGKVMLDIP
ncbi:hypothetical protein ACTMU2_41325 [Cupriavidus basilensis]